MQIDVRRIVQISSLKHAKIAAGRAGMSREVRSLTVLEITDMEDVGIDILAIKPGDLVLSAFFDIKDQVGKQCDTIRELDRANAAGLVLFYIGQVIERIDPAVTELCNQLRFPLLCLDSEASQTVSYSVVMNEVAEILLHRNSVVEKAEINIINAILKHNQLNEPLQAALGYIAGELDVSVLVMTPGLHVLEEAGGRSETLLGCVQAYAKEPGEQDPAEAIAEIRGANGEPVCYCRRVEVAEHPFLFAFCAEDGGEISRAQQYSLFHILDLTASLWMQDLAGRDERQFISAVIRGDRRSAESLHAVDPERVRAFLLFRGSFGEERYAPLQQAIDELAEAEGLSVIHGSHQQFSILLLAAEYPCDLRSHLEELSAVPVVTDLLVCVPLTGGREELFALLPAAIKLYPTAMGVFRGRAAIGKWELLQLRDCLAPPQEGNWDYTGVIAAAVESYDEKNGSSLWETLESFLLIHGMNYKRTGGAMFVHHNTIQYRIRKVEELCQLSLALPADLAAVYRAVVMRRILNSN